MDGLTTEMAIPADHMPATDLLYYTISRLEKALGRAFETIALRHGFSQPELVAALVLAEGVPVSNAQLARRTFVSSQASHELITVLVNRGLVQREAHETNKRIKLLSLTEEGWKVANACQADLLEVEQRATQKLAPNNRDDLIRLLSLTAETIRGGYFGDEEAESEALELRAKSRER